MSELITTNLFYGSDGRLTTNDKLTVIKRPGVTKDFNGLGTELTQYVPNSFFPMPGQRPGNLQRGYDVWFLTDLLNVSGKNKSGQMIQGFVEQPLFGVSVADREDIFFRFGVIQGIVTARAKRISNLEWHITRTTKIEDQIAENLQRWADVFDEWDEPDDPTSLAVRFKMMKNIRQVLPDVRPDLANFDKAMLRWSKKIKSENQDRSNELEDWLAIPNTKHTYSEFVQEWIHTLMVHGAGAIYKYFLPNDEGGENLEMIYNLPGGSVTPLHTKYVGGGVAYIQMPLNVESFIYYKDEVAFTNYIPVAGRSYGAIPIEACLNKIAESLFFDQLMSERADGSRPVEKLLVFGKPWGAGGLSAEEGYDIPMDEGRQRRIETEVNQLRKNAVKVLSGVGTPFVLDLERGDTIAFNIQRQDKVIRDIALIFNATNAEVNLSGSEDTSGRATSESMERLEREKGIYPIVKSFEDAINYNILPYRGGDNYTYEIKTGLTDMERVQIENMMMSTGTYSINEIREKRGDDPYDSPEYDRPPEGGPKKPDGSKENPLQVQSSPTGPK